MGGRLSLTGTTDGGRGEGVVLMVILCVEGRGEGVITHYSCLQVMVQCYKQTNQGHINWGSHVPHVSLQSFDKTTDFSE